MRSGSHTGAAAAWAGILLASCLAVVLPSSARAWLPGGSPVCTATGDQSRPKIVADAAGGTYAAWLDLRGSTPAMFLQRLTPDGSVSPGWPLDGTFIASLDTTLSCNCFRSFDICPDGAGGVYTSWTDPAADAVHLARYTTSGTLHPDWPLGGIVVSGSVVFHTYWMPTLVADGSGGAIVAFFDSFFDGVNSVSHLRASRVDSFGTSSWGGSVLLTTTATSWQQMPRDLPYALVADGSGGAFAVFQINISGFDVWAQHVTSGGTIATGWGSDGNVIADGTGEQQIGGAVSDGAGGFLTAWFDDGSNPAEAEFWASRILSDGTLPAGWSAGGNLIGGRGSTAWTTPGICGDGSGGAFIAWDDAVSGDILIRRISSAGQLQWSGPVPVVTASMAQTTPFLAEAPGGNTFVTWYVDTRAGIGNDDAYAQFVSGDGRLGHASFAVALADTTGNQLPFGIVATPLGPYDGVVVIQDSRGTDDDIYAMGFTMPGNIDATFVSGTPGGDWGTPVVPRDVADATPSYCPLPATLPGNQPSTYGNWNILREVEPLPTFDHQLLLDSVPIETLTLTETSLWDPGSSTIQLGTNRGPFTVRGGRHTMEQSADPADGVPESDETDNDWGGQWVWSPLALSWQGAISRAVPPDPGLLPLPNSDGFTFTRDSSYAWVVAMAGHNAGDDYDLMVYDDYSGSESGFSNLRGYSLYGSNYTDLVVGHYSTTPTTILPAAVLYTPGGGGTDFSMDASDARFGNAGAAATYLNQVLGPDRLADVYEAYLDPGATIRFALRRESGASDLALAIFPGTPGFIGSLGDAAALSLPVDPTYDTLDFAPTASGWYPIVVFRTTGTGADVGLTYSLFWGDTIAVDAPEVAPAAGPARLDFSGAWPNPTRSATQLRFELPVETRVRLSLIDVTGRRLRTLLSSREDAGPGSVTWDLRDQGGSRVASGIYYARFEAMGKVFTRSVTVLR